MPIKHLVFSGGAYKGFYTLGALKHLSETSFYKLDNIENIYGASVGSIISLIICLKLNWDDIIEHLINRPWQNLFNFSTEDIWNIISNKGLLHKDFIYSLFDILFKNAGLSKEATLKDIYDYSKIVLHIYAVNSATFTLEEFTHITNPDMKVLDVVYMSCSIPFIFQPLYIEKCYYIDAGVINPYPLDLCLKQHDKEEILGFKIVDDKFNTCCEKTSIFYFGFYLFYRLINANYKHIINKKIPYEMIIPGDVLSINEAQKIINNSEIRKKMIDQGVKYAKLFLRYNIKNN